MDERTKYTLLVGGIIGAAVILFIVVALSGLPIWPILLVIGPMLGMAWILWSSIDKPPPPPTHDFKSDLDRRLSERLKDD